MKISELTGKKLWLSAECIKSKIMDPDIRVRRKSSEMER